MPNFEELAEKSLQAIGIYQDRHLVYCNPAQTELYGYSRDEQVAMTVEQLNELVHPEDRHVVDERLRLRLAGEPVNPHVELRIVRKDGALRWIRSFNNLMEFNERPAALTTTIDITGERQAQALAAELGEAMRQVQKMEVLGRLAGGIAHDFNNLMSVISLEAHYVESFAQRSPELRDALAPIAAAAETGAELTRRLLSFTRHELPQRHEVDLSVVVSEMAGMLQRLVGSHIRWRVEAAPEPLLVNVESGALEQVLLNLVLNARDAMPRGGVIQIETGASEHEGPGDRSGRWCWVRVADTGTGIPAEILPRIFEARFTTKARGRGTGLGLATVQQVVEQHHGWIEVQSEVGRGTTFRAVFPGSSNPRATG